MKYYWYEVWVIARKALVVFITVFLSTRDVNSQVLFALAVLLAGAFLQMLDRPYQTERVNRLEELALLVLVFNYFMAVFFQNSELVRESPTIQPIMIGLCILMVLVYVLYSGHSVYPTVKVGDYFPY